MHFDRSECIFLLSSSSLYNILDTISQKEILASIYRRIYLSFDAGLTANNFNLPRQGSDLEIEF